MKEPRSQVRDIRLNWIKYYGFSEIAAGGPRVAAICRRPRRFHARANITRASPRGGSIQETSCKPGVTASAHFTCPRLKLYMQRIDWARGPAGLANLGNVG